MGGGGVYLFRCVVAGVDMHSVRRKKSVVLVYTTFIYDAKHRDDTTIKA